MMQINQLSLYQYQIPLTRPLPVGIQRIDQRQGLVLILEVDRELEQGGHVIQVEVAPLSGTDIDGAPLRGFSFETLAEVKQALEGYREALLGQDIGCLKEIANACQLPSLAYGLSLAYHKAKGELPKARRVLAPVPLIYHLEDEPLTVLHERLDSLDETIHVVKVKVAQTSMEQELELIYQILARKPKMRLRLDANRGFDLESAIAFSASLPLPSVDYIEEPCIDPRDNLKLFQATGIRFALDESLNSAEFVFVPEPGLSALVVKPMVLGSLDKLQSLTDEATKHGVRTILSSSLETSLGIEALVDLSAVLTPDEAPGVDTLGVFSADVLVSSGKKTCFNLDRLSLVF